MFISTPTASPPPLSSNSVARIRQMSTRLANQIAAGEVVERPASVVKELLENSIDAGSRQIFIDIESGGKQLIRIRDDGHGICQEDLPLAVSRHATSKIQNFEDLTRIASLGFRGEALASISAISRFALTSKTFASSQAYCLQLVGLELAPQVSPAAHPIGTTIEIRDLFFNTPARRRFLKSDRTEFLNIQEWVKRIALAYPRCEIRLTHNGRTQLHYLPANGEHKLLSQRIHQVFGSSAGKNTLPIEHAFDGLHLWGYLAPLTHTLSTSDQQYFFVNGRGVRDKLIQHALRQAYEDKIYPGRHAVFCLFLECDPALVDVNVHPMKLEVRFHEARLVHDFIYKCVQEHLCNHKNPFSSTESYVDNYDDISSTQSSLNFVETKLNETQLNETKVNATQLNETKVNATKLNEAKLNETKLNEAQLNETKLNEAQLNETKLNEAQLNEAQLNETKVNATKLNQTKVNEAQLNETQLNETKLNETKLNATKLNATKLNETKLNETKVNATKIKTPFIAAKIPEEKFSSSSLLLNKDRVFTELHPTSDLKTNSFIGFWGQDKVILTLKMALYVIDIQKAYVYDVLKSFQQQLDSKHIDKIPFLTPKKCYLQFSDDEKDFDEKIITSTSHKHLPIMARKIDLFLEVLMSYGFDVQLVNLNKKSQNAADDNLQLSMLQIFQIPKLFRNYLIAELLSDVFHVWHRQTNPANADQRTLENYFRQALAADKYLILSLPRLQIQWEEWSQKYLHALTSNLTTEKNWWPNPILLHNTLPQ